MSAAMASPPKISSIIPLFVIGGSSWSDQLVVDPRSLPVRETILRALDLGFRAFDTSPYYGPSEVLLGDAFAQPDLRVKYPRESYIIMTKCGRIKADEFDYSPAWVRKSVERSLERFSTDYLDVVFCHDVEFVGTEADVLDAVGELLKMKSERKIRNVGISGYPLDVLLNYALKVKEVHGCPLDAVQTYCHYTLQNSTLVSKGYLRKFRDEAGVDCIFNSSPMAIGLLRKEGVPVGELGDFHPAPNGLRDAAKKAAEWVESKGDDLASLALRYAVGKFGKEAGVDGIATIFAGAGSIEQLEMNLETLKRVLGPTGEGKGKYGDARDLTEVKTAIVEADEELYRGVKEILGEWVDYSWKSPDEGFLNKKRTNT